MNNMSVKQRSTVRYVSVGLLVLVALLLVGVAQVSYTVRVTEAEAQTLLDAQLVKLRAKNLAYEVDHVTIHFIGDHMTVEAAGGYNKQIGNFPELQVTAALSSTGAPDYRGGSIYFLASVFSLDSFLLNGEVPNVLIKRLVASAVTEKIPQLRDEALAHPKVSKWLDKLGVSVDTVQNDVALTEGAAVVDSLVEKYREPAKALLEQKVRDLLQTTPLYTLGKNWKEQLALAALSDISIKDGVLTATLTGMRLLLTLFLGLVALLSVGGAVVGFARVRAE